MLKDMIKYSMGHLSRKQYISLLARPNWRKLQRKNIHTSTHPFRIRRAALKARASKRIKIISRPKYVSKKYDPQKAPSSYPRIHPKTLAAKSTKRITDLALPRKRLLLANMKFPTSGTIAKTLGKVQNSRYRRYRFFCSARQQREMKKKQEMMAKLRRVIKADEWDAHMETLERLSTPKVHPRPRFVGRRKKWRPVNMRRIDDLSTPVVKEIPEVRDIGQVPESALTYQITRRLQEMAYPKKREGTMPDKILGEVAPAALKAVASPRLIDLAKPIERPAGMETDLREDAFTVSPQALKAKCSRRLKILARPKRVR